MIIKIILLSILIGASMFMLYFFCKLSKYEKDMNNYKNKGSYSYDDAFGYTEMPKFDNK